MSNTLPEWLQQVIKEANEITAILVIKAIHNSRRHQTGITGRLLNEQRKGEPSIRKDNN